MKLSKNKRLALWYIALPMLLATVYYVFIAVNRYVSESKIAVFQGSSSTSSSAASSISSLIGGSSLGSALAGRPDTLFARDYILSLDMLLYLDKTLNLRKHYEAQKLDPFYKLVWFKDTQENFLAYYQSRVALTFDEESGILDVKVEGFDPVFAKKLNEAILARTEDFVNESSQKMARNQMQFAERELEVSRVRYAEAKSKLLAFQNKYGTLDPAAEAQSRFGLTSDLENQIAAQDTALKNLLTYLNPDSYQVIAQRNLLQSLRAQLDSEKKRIASPEGQRLNTLAGEFRNLTIDFGFAEDSYKLTMNALETARLQASNQLKLLAVISKPGLPDEAIYPTRVYNLITLLIGLCLAFGIVRFSVSTIADHQD